MLTKFSFFAKIENMYDRLLKITDNSSCFLFGPRGTGKTTWLRSNFSDALYFDLLNDELYSEFLANPTRLNENIPTAYTGWVILDEIQRVPKLLNEVHRLIESRKLQFILTGSSARTLRRKGVNLLAGRALTYHMHPLTTIEQGGDFDFHHAIQYGCLPSVISHGAPKEYLASYIATYLREEVLQEGLTRDLSSFARFLETASFSQGEVLSYTNIAREAHNNRHTIKNYFDILEDLLIAHRLPCFTKKAKRALVSHPKFYYFDVGVYRTIRPRGPLDSAEDLEGPALETLFLQEARAINDYFKFGYEFYYWRTQSQAEIDFVLYGARGLSAFEIKRKARITKNDLKNLKLFKHDYPMAKTYLLYGGEKTYWDNDVQIIPYKSALTRLKDLI